MYKDMNISPYKVVWLGDFSEDVCCILEESDGKTSVRTEAVQ